jgi:hypothetical protein
MKVIQKISVFALIVFLITSSVGISFYLHECGCREATLFSFEAGYSESVDFCCCSSEQVSSNDNSCDKELDNEGCCKDKYFFLLLPIAPDKVKVNIPSLNEKIIPQIIKPLIVFDETSANTGDTISNESPPGTKSGKELVYFISQIKIPFRTC